MDKKLNLQVTKGDGVPLKNQEGALLEFKRRALKVDTKTAFGLFLEGHTVYVVVTNATTGEQSYHQLTREEWENRLQVVPINTNYAVVWKEAGFEPVIGKRYNWKNQPERLIYIGKKGAWHQFYLVGGDPGNVWCEVLDKDLHYLEETK